MVLQPGLPNQYMTSKQRMQNQIVISRVTHIYGKNLTFKKYLREMKFEGRKKA